MTTHAGSTRKRSPAVKLSLAAALMVAMLGCGDNPTAPIADTNSTGRSGDTQPAAGYITTNPIGGYSGTNLTSAIQPVPAPVTGSVISSSRKISALLGGTITAGRHTLVIPPLALTKDTIITLRDVTGQMGRVECEALPEGLKFRLPATLITRFSDLRLPQGHGMYHVIDEGTPSEQWVYVGSQISVGNIGISALLHHFSRYAPGKNGW